MDPFLPLELAYWIDLPSMFFVGSGSTLPVVVTRGNQRTQLLEGMRRISLPVGMMGTLVGFILILHNMSDPSALEPAFQIALLSVWYGISAYGISSFFLRKKENKYIDGVIYPSSRGAFFVGGLLLFFLVSILNESWIDTSSMGIFLLGLPLIAVQKNVIPRSYRIMRSGIIIGMFGSLYGMGATLYFWDDPTSIGPSIAISLISALYATIIVIGSAPLVPTKLNPHMMRWQYLFLGVNLLVWYALFSMVASLL